MIRYRLVTWAILLLIMLSPLASLAQDRPAPATAPPAGGEQQMKPEQLDALLAPIALYPDNLLSLVLIASTYPLEVVQADRWIKENKALKGDAQKAAVDKQAWDDSIKSLVATPDVLSMMSTKLDWTMKLGDAVLAQQPDVMDAIQRLRARADANNKLTTTKEQKVTKRQEQGKQIIAIESTDPDMVYVPYYEPAVAYGAWPYPDYPPTYFGWPSYIPGAVIATGLAFGAGYALNRWRTGGNYWGGGVNWTNNNINVNRPRVNPLNGNNWQHNPAHRQGVRYNNANVAQRFGNNDLRASAQNRMDYRGRGGNQVLRPDAGQRPTAGQRPGGDRPNAGQRPSQGRPNAGQRPSGGRPSAGQRPSGGRTAGQRPSGSRPSAGQGNRPRAAQSPRGRGGNALGGVGGGGAARAQAARGRASFGGGGGGGFRGGGGGGGFRGGGGGRGGGRRSDIALKHDVVLLGYLPNGIGLYRFSYNGSNRRYVGVIAQDIQAVAPDAVTRGRDGYLRVYYEKLGIRFQTYDQWIASPGRMRLIVDRPN